MLKGVSLRGRATENLEVVRRAVRAQGSSQCPFSFGVAACNSTAAAEESARLAKALALSFHAPASLPGRGLVTRIALTGPLAMPLFPPQSCFS